MSNVPLGSMYGEWLLFPVCCTSGSEWLTRREWLLCPLLTQLSQTATWGITRSSLAEMVKYSLGAIGDLKSVQFSAVSAIIAQGEQCSWRNTSRKLAELNDSLFLSLSLKKHLFEWHYISVCMREKIERGNRDYIRCFIPSKTYNEFSQECHLILPHRCQEFRYTVAFPSALTGRWVQS